MYNSHEDDPETGPVLKGIGQPYIVVAGLPANELCAGRTLTECFINVFLRSAGITTRNKAEFESSVEKPVPAKCLTHVISSADARFTLLTGRAK